MKTVMIKPKFLKKCSHFIVHYINDPQLLMPFSNIKEWISRVDESFKSMCEADINMNEEEKRHKMLNCKQISMFTAPD